MRAIVWQGFRIGVWRGRVMTLVVTFRRRGGGHHGLCGQTGSHTAPVEAECPERGCQHQGTGQDNVCQ